MPAATHLATAPVPAFVPHAPAVVPQPAAILPTPAPRLVNQDRPQLSTQRRSEVHARRAAVVRRLLAWTLDALPIAAIVTGYLRAASWRMSPRPPPSLPGLDALMGRMHILEPVLLRALILGTALSIAYSAAFAIASQGRTLGRRVLGIRLVDSSGRPPGPVRTILRALLSIASFAFLLGGVWLAIFDRKGQTLHDKLTATYLVRMS